MEQKLKVRFMLTHNELLNWLSSDGLEGVAVRKALLLNKVQKGEDCGVHSSSGPWLLKPDVIENAQITKWFINDVRQGTEWYELFVELTVQCFTLDLRIYFTAGVDNEEAHRWLDWAIDSMTTSLKRTFEDEFINLHWLER